MNMEKKKSGQQKSNFDRLASDLTVKERKDLLNKVNPADIEIQIPNDSALTDKKLEKERQEEKKKGLEVQFKKEPFLKKIIVWVKSFILNISVEEVYNNAVIGNLARRIEVLYPGLIDFKHRTICNGIYKELMQLQMSQDFFNNTLRINEVDAGVFYYLLCLHFFPEFTDSIKKACDPFQNGVSKPMGPDARNVFLNKIDEVFSSMSADIKNKMSAVSQSYEWIKMFSKLPVPAMINKFAVNGDDRSCMFSQLKFEYSEFTKILCAKIKITDEFVPALFAATSELNDLWKMADFSFSSDDVSKVIENASVEISNVVMFANKYPLRELGKIINENSLFMPDLYSPGDGWLTKLREEWRIVFDQRWRLWNREFKKEEVKKKMKLFFGLNDFQKFPYHPWKKYENEFPFRYDLSLGFVNFYLKQEYLKYASILNIITLEGDFQIKENRHEFTDLVADYNEVMDKLDVLVSQVALGGEFGSEFLRYENSPKSGASKEKLKVVINEIEESAQYILEVFLNSAHKFENLVSAMLGEYSTAYYGPLVNLNKIMGRDNVEFREKLSKFSHSIKYAYDIMNALEEIDSLKV